jgi:hypothetical protein
MEQERKEKYQKRILFENPYDIETILQSLSIASQNGREIIFMDRLISHIRLDPTIETTELSYNILRELELLKLEKTE